MLDQEGFMKMSCCCINKHKHPPCLMGVSSSTVYLAQVQALPRSGIILSMLFVQMNANITEIRQRPRAFYLLVLIYER